MKDWIKSLTRVFHKRNNQGLLTKLVCLAERDIHKSNPSLLVNSEVANSQDLGRVSVKDVLWDQVLLSEEAKESDQYGAPDCQIFLFLYINKLVHLFQMIHCDWESLERSFRQFPLQRLQCESELEGVPVEC